jgi:dolichol-phosphate mannosyltransferase
MESKIVARTIWVVLPCYNEEANLNSLFDRFENVFLNLTHLGFIRKYIVVDDGSKDKSPVILKQLSEKLPVEIITHSPNQGLGATIRDGLKRASQLGSEQDIIITLDCDNSQPPELIVSMILKIIEGNHVVIASRFRYGSAIVGLPRKRIWMSIFAGIIFKFGNNIRNVKDYTCGFRAYDTSLIKRAFQFYKERFIEQAGFQCMAEIIIKLNRIPNTLFYEVPMILRYDNKGGESKMQVMKTVIGTLKMLLFDRFRKNI